MRQQRPRGTTTRDSVVQAALDVVDQVGLDALTIRAVAAAVSAPPMSLYTHFANKEELMNLMYGAVTARLYVDSGCATWQTELSALGHHIRETLLAHPRWTPILSRRTAPTVVGVRERVLAMMAASGFTAPAALTGLSSIVLSTIGLVLVELTYREPDGGSTLTGRFNRLKALFDESEPSEAPTIHEAFAKAPVFEFTSLFDFSVKALITGLEQSVAPRAAR
jgi:TetR/AcrR family tetracycline transcriptional repressor